MSEEGWKPGQKAVIVTSGWSTVYTPVVIQKVHKSGNAVLKSGDQYRPDGRRAGKRGYQHGLLHPLTEELVREMEDVRARSERRALLFRVIDVLKAELRNGRAPSEDLMASLPADLIARATPAPDGEEA